MTDPFRDDYTYLTELPEELRDRRRAAARRRRWRRRLAIAGLLAVVGAVVAVAVTSFGGGGSGGGEEQAQRPTTAAQAGTPSYPADWVPHPGPVPILEYHAIQPPVVGAADPQAFVPQADFGRQMEWLHEQGFTAATLDQVETAWYEDGRLPPKPIVVSFDDGYLSQYVAGFLVLQRYRWPGVLNLVAEGSDLPDADVKKMIDAGWELASQGNTGVDLTALSPAELQREVAGSRQVLRSRYGVPVDNFAYPDGRYDNAVIGAVRDAGYVGAQSELPGLAGAAHPYILNRIEVELDDGLPGFVSKLRTAGAV